MIIAMARETTHMCLTTGEGWCACPADLCEADDLHVKNAQLAGALTLWLNYAPIEVRELRPNPRGKSLEEIAREALHV
jgi:hypothetical protein